MDEVMGLAASGKRMVSRPNSPESKRLRGSSTVDVPPPSKVSRLLFRTISHSGTWRGVNYYIMDLNPSDFDFIRQPEKQQEEEVDGSIVHDHNNSSPCYANRFRRTALRPSLGSLIYFDPPADDITLASLPVVAGDSIYVLFHKRNPDPYPYPSTVYLKSVNIHNGEHHSMDVTSSCRRFFPRLFALRRKVFFIGGTQPQGPFATCFDTVSNSWHPLPDPPNALLMIKYNLDLFISSLGEKEGKIMVYDFTSPLGVIYIYDITTDKWEEFVCDAFDDTSYRMGPYSVVGIPVPNEDDCNVYWLHADRAYKRRLRQFSIYAFDWKTKQLYSGPLPGMNHEFGLDCSRGHYSRATLHHLWSDTFCLFWSEDVASLDERTVSEFHFTFLRVIKNSSTNSLTAHVVGCCVYPIAGDHSITDSLFF